MTVTDPRAAVAALAASREPYLLGVRHHSPALAAVVPALLEESGAEVVCVELPAEFQPWLAHLADPETLAPVALAGLGRDGRLAFYPFADFSPELAAVRWARGRGVEVVCCDLPLADRGWCAEPEGPGDAGGPQEGSGRRRYADGLVAAASGRAGDDLWDRAVEVPAPGCTPEAVRRAALGVGWALRVDADAVPGVDLAREAHMRWTLAAAAAGGRRVAAVIGAFHAPALLPGHAGPTAREAGREPDPRAAGAAGGAADAEAVVGAGGGAEVVTSFVPYSFDLLDSRSGYPAGIRDPLWQQAVLAAGGDPERVREAASVAVTGVCRELRRAGHTAGTGEAAETLRLACDLAVLRGLPAPGRGEVVEAVQTVLGHGDPLGRGRALARALEAVLVGAGRGRTTPHAPRSGLGPAVEAELAGLRLPSPEDPAAREVRLDPLRSELDGRREVLLQRLLVCGAAYGEPVAVAAAGDGTALGSKWRLSWTPSVPARLDLAGVRGVTAAQAAAGTLREVARREAAEGGPTAAQVLTGLAAAARCDLPELVDVRLEEVAEVLPATAGLPELLAAVDLLEGLRRGHLPAAPGARERAGALVGGLLDTAVRALPGLAGSDDPADAGALVALADRAAARRLGLRMDAALAELGAEGSPLMRGAALAVRVLLDLDPAAGLGARAAAWVDGAASAEGRRTLARRLTGLLSAAGPLLDASAAALTPLLDRVEGLADAEFLERLPALRAGFDVLAPAARERLLATVTERLGDRVDLSLDAPPALLALWSAADAAGQTALASLPPGPGPAGAVPAMPVPAGSGRAGAVPAGSEPAVAVPAGRAPAAPVPATPAPTAPLPAGPTKAAPAPAGPTQPEPTQAPLVPAGAVPGVAVPAGAVPVVVVPATPTPAGPTPAGTTQAAPELAGAAPAAVVPVDLAPAAPEPAGPASAGPVPAGGGRRLGGGERWRLLLGRERDRLPAGARRYARALDELYGEGRGDEPSFPTAREWSAELESLFGADVREEVLADAAGAGRTDVLAQLDPASVRPSVELLTSVLSLAGGMPEQQLARLRPLVRRLVDELAKELATRLRPALTGVATPRPTRRPGGRLDLARTLRANLAHTRRTADGRVVVVPERPVFRTRASREADWRLILVVDVSGSMEASVIWSALTAAVLGGVPTLSTHFLAFSTEVADLTDRVDDPLSLLLGVRVGGGTHIAAGLAHARTLVTVPSRTLVVVVSDFEEGAPLAGLLGEVRALAASGAHLLGCAALDDAGAPRYSVPVARQLVAAGMPVAALSPLALARWVGDRLRGEPR
ncbi:DUF5682 family protein [Streptomyces sp. NPDC048551]|uniref:DUF5682 family protein n=1 Tax=Streptomyces sp. NPDC048551 TaxID=3155758 RepID=UPI003440B010